MAAAAHGAEVEIVDCRSIGGVWALLAATDWVAKHVAIEGLAGFTDDQAYRAMDFLLAENADGIWPRVAEAGSKSRRNTCELLIFRQKGSKHLCWAAPAEHFPGSGG